MKKILLFASALAGLFLAASCQQENLEPVMSGNTVTYTVQVADAAATKVIGNDVTAVNELVYEVYRTVDEDETEFTKDVDNLLYHKTATVQPDGTFNIELEFINDQNFTVLFWAQTKDNGVYNVDNLTNVKIINQDVTNLENTAVFVGRDFVRDCVSEKNGKVTLVRPVSQINIGTTAESLDIEGQTDVVLEGSTVKVKGLATTYNIATLSATGNATTEYAATYTERPVPQVDLTLTAGTYEYVAMNYVGFASNEGSTITVSYIINTTEGNIENEIENVPVKPNYRTNIIGNLITSKADYTITLDKQWYDADGGNMEVIEEGLIRNVNGDYEISEAKGLAYAINNLWANGGDFYLTAAEYDMEGLNVTPATIAADKALNIYGETPVVTRAMTSIAGITIKGLESIIKTIPDGANVSISGVELVDEGSVLVETNNGTLVVSESTGEEKVVGNGNDPVKADDVKDVATLNAALASAVKTINITESFAAGDVVLVGRSVVINGNDKTFTTSANRAFRLTASNIEVVFNNLDIVSTAVMTYPTDVRGVSIDANLSNVDLTLNECTIDFTDKTANDWTYAVNVSGNGTGHRVTVNGGTYEGANVINVHGAKNVITVKNAVLNCLYPNNDVYYGACIWVLQKHGSSVYAEGNTFNGSNAIAFNLGTGTDLEEKDNVDNTKMVVAKVGEAYYTSLAEAFAAAESGATVKVLHNTEMTPKTPVTVASGKTITLDLNGKTITGIDNASGSYGLITNKGNLTVVGPGSMTLTATNNREWNAYSSVISNTVGGNLTVEGGAVLEHLGGTDMAYGIDNLTNGKGTSAVTTIKDATVISTYRAVRQFLNGIEATNELYVEEGAVITGANKSIWMQDPSAKLNKGKLVVEEGAELNGDVYLFVTAGSEAWPVEVSIADSALAGESTVMTGNVPAGYEVENVGGTWKVIKWSEVSTADELVAALAAGQNVIFKNDITVAATDGGYNKAGILQNKGQAINGNGYTLTVTGAGATWSCAIYTNGGLIKNLTVAGAMRGIFTAGQSSDLHIDNVVFKNVIYTFNSDGTMPAKPFGVYISNSTVNGWTSHSDMHSEVVYTNCSFGEGSGYKFCRPYGKTSFVNCTFCAGYTIDQSQTKDITFDNCTFKE